jgi:V/A-type H+-transporting ATPase subunit E
MESDVDRITSKIIEDAEKKSREIIEQAKKEANEKLEASKRRGEALKGRLVEEAEKNADQTTKKIIAESKIKARTILLESKEKLIQIAFEKAKDELEAIPTDKTYPAVLVGLMKDTCIKMGGGELEIMLNSRDEKKIEKELKTLENEIEKATGEKTKVKISTANISPGVIVKGRGGRVEIDSTFKNRLDLLRPGLRLKVAEALFS